jgi:predicted transposase YbfD/YdcC
VVSFLGIVCGANNWAEVSGFGHCKEEWLKTFLELPHGIPSHDTFSRFFAILDPVQFEECFTNWVQSLNIDVKGDIIAIDGKASRASRSKGSKALHMISAWSCNNGLVLGQCRVDKKTNEIKILPELLKRLKIAGSTITTDALNCQKSIANNILHQGANYILAVKKNQKDLYTNIEKGFHYADNTTIDTGINHFESIDGEHGRIETRKYSVLPALYASYDITKNWPGLQSIARVVSTREIGNNIAYQTRYFISSLPPVAESIAKGIRAHWQVESAPQAHKVAA